MDLAEKMEEIAWNRIQEVDPDWANDYLSGFRELTVGPDIFVREAMLHRRLEAQIARFQYEEKIPDFSALKTEALAALNSDGE